MAQRERERGRRDAQTMASRGDSSLDGSPQSMKRRLPPLSAMTLSSLAGAKDMACDEERRGESESELVVVGEEECEADDDLRAPRGGCRGVEVP